MGKYGGAGEATDDNTTRRMRIACWITKATHTRSEYVIIIDFTQQQWFRERASMLCYGSLPVLFIQSFIQIRRVYRSLHTQVR